MGIKPPENVQIIGRKLHPKFDFGKMNEQLNEGEILVGLFDRGVFYNAPQITTESEFNSFVGQVKSGNVQMIGFYALAKEQWSAGGDQ